MNLLLCLESENDFGEVLKHIGYAGNASTSSATTIEFLAHKIDVLITGKTAEKTAKNTEKILSQKRYHLALFAGFAESWKATIPLGTVVNVIREKSTENADFSNRNNNYLNIFFEFKKVFSADKKNEEKADVFSENGIAFVEQCVQENQPFYQLRVIEHNAATGEFDKEKARKILNETLISILAVI